MVFLLISFIAGILTVLAPCVLPLLPVIIGGSIASGRKSRPYIVVLSLSISIILFTFILKVSTAFISIPSSVWQWISGGILILFGASMILPSLYERALLKFNLIVGRKGNQLIAEGVKKESIKGDILIGAALGPVFSSCSPTYFVILATVLPASFLKGFVYLVAYTLGLSIMLLLISKLGQRLVGRLQGASDPRSIFKKTLGVIFVLVGIFVISGFDKKIQTSVIQSGIFDITRLETKLLDMAPQSGDELQTAKGEKYPRFAEIKDPAGFVNSGPFKLKDFIGKKVILLDFMTYSCINCQRTFPYLAKWYETYEKDGLLIVGIHTPEFAFEKKKENVEAAMKQFGLNFPVVLDNEYGTWNNYGNNVWPRKYLIDIDGFVVYDHKGEGAYMEIEEKIKELLNERAERLNDKISVSGNIASTIIENKNFAQSPETYFGALRNTNFASEKSGKTGQKVFRAGDSKDLILNKLYISGTWNIDLEFAKAIQHSFAYFRFEASKVFLVASSPAGGTINVFKDNVLIRKVDVKDSKLYTLIDEGAPTKGLLKLEVSPGVELYAFTFG